MVRDSICYYLIRVLYDHSLNNTNQKLSNLSGFDKVILAYGEAIGVISDENSENRSKNTRISVVGGCLP